MIYLLLSSLFIFIIFLFDIGNPDALRQGTEGFYLQVAQEMFEKKSILTPYYQGAPHWSKPPFSFTSAQVFYYIFGKSSLFLSRLSVLITSIFLTALASNKISSLKKVKIDSFSFFLFLFSTVGFFKYSRIFMMEMPLLILGFLSAIYFFSYLENDKKRDFWMSILFGALSCNVKGPVSIFMLFSSFLSYSIYHYLVFKKSNLLKTIVWFVTVLLFSSFWFLYEYQEYGNDFINYFFLRENLGKFSSKSYPIIHVFQGLFLYSLPWSLLTPFLIWKYRVSGSRVFSNPKYKFNSFCIISFIFFFCIWLIPQQRSHHYAMPAVPFFLFLIYENLFSEKEISNKIKYLLKPYLFATMSLGIILLLITLSLDGYSLKNIHLFYGLFLLIISFILSFYKNPTVLRLSLSHTLILITFWSFLFPHYILPIVPQKVRKESREKKIIGTVHRKPYFVSESLGREVSILTLDKVRPFLKKDGSAVVLSKNHFLLLQENSKYLILKEWDVWKRGINLIQIIDALKKKNLKSLKNQNYFIQSR